MILNDQQKKQIKKHIYEIDEMGKQELHGFVRDLYLAKEDLDKTVFKWVLRACDIKEAELQEITEYSPEVVLSAVDYDVFRNDN